MKVGFLETIKQKTDCELERVSKDYLFYSEEERLVALNELEFRNKLSNELNQMKKDVEEVVEKKSENAVPKYYIGGFIPSYNGGCLYVGCVLFVIVSIIMIAVSKETTDILLGVMILLAFCAGGMSTYMIQAKKKKNIEQEQIITITDNRSKMTVSLLCYLSLVIVSYLFLPFNHIFDDTHTSGFRRYTPTIGYIVGISGILFFGWTFFLSITRLVKPRLILQISDKGLVIKKQVLIAWKDVKNVKRNDTSVVKGHDRSLFICLKNPELYDIKRDYVTINLDSTYYSTEQIASFIRNKLHENTKI